MSQNHVQNLLCPKTLPKGIIGGGYFVDTEKVFVTLVDLGQVFEMFAVNIKAFQNFEWVS